MVHLHLHSKYSLLDGVIKFDELVKKVKEEGMSACAITDHGNCYGAIDFYEACKAADIKPIIGCEVYVAPRSRFDKDHSLDAKANHLVLLAKNNQGYKNLCKLVSAGYTEGFYSKPRVDKELLKKYSEGLIVTSACIAGSIPSAIINGDMKKANDELNFFKKTFGDDFYIEIQNHGIKEEAIIADTLVKMAKENNIKIVGTNDAHYLEKSDADMQDVMLCIQTKSYLDQEDRFRFPSNEFYFKNEEELRKSLAEVYPADIVDEAIKNTDEVAEKCNVEFEFGVVKLPDYDIPAGFSSHFEYLKDLSTKGLIKRYGQNCPKEYIERLDYELNIINSMGFVGYFLIVWDFINWAKEHDIPIGPGRGSGAGSIVAYSIGITNLDPMRFNLLFERFLNPERVSMPDFDIDICFERRQEVIEYVTEKYGAERVSKIVTFGTIAAKTSILDVARVMRIPDVQAKKISDMIPLGSTLAEAMNLSDLKNEYNTNPVSKKIIDMAVRLEGLPRNISTHAAGILIADKDITEYAPLTVSGGDVAIQFPMTTLEKLGLIKMDFLGLRTLTVIRNAENAIKKNHPEFNMEDIDLDDQETFSMLSSGDTAGVFQFESTGMKSTIMQLQPTCLEDLIAIISLYRPGPMDSIPTYIENKHNPSKIVYADERLKDITGVTYGVLVYQEQIMKMFQSLAGFSFGRADIVRRGMAKKKIKYIEEEKKHFIHGLKDENGNVIIEGALARGVDEKVASDLMDQMTSFASYAFNKSHAAAYAKVAYQTAYLKRHFPLEYQAANITSLASGGNNVMRFKAAIAGCHDKMEILPPDVNKSDVVFCIEDGKIRYGLNAVSNVNTVLARKIVADRNLNGPYTDLTDFVRRIYDSNLRSNALESLIDSGAFDFSKETRQSMNQNSQNIIAEVKPFVTVINSQVTHSIYEFLNPEEVIPYFHKDLIPFEEYETGEILNRELKAAKMYFSGHPLDDYKNTIQTLGFQTLAGLIISAENKELKAGDVVLAVRISEIARKMSKKKQPYLSMIIEDLTSSVETCAYGNFINKYNNQIEDNMVCIAKCFVKPDDANGISIAINEIYPLPKDNANNYEAELDGVRRKVGSLLTNKKISSIKAESKVQKKKTAVAVAVNDFENDSNIDRIQSIAEKHPGLCSLYLVDLKNKKKCKCKIQINPDASCIEELKEVTQVFIS